MQRFISSVIAMVSPFRSIMRNLEPLRFCATLRAERFGRAYERLNSVLLAWPLFPDRADLCEERQIVFEVPLSVILPSLTRRISVAIKLMGWPLPATLRKTPVKCP
jgi:hypothetical protein